MKRILKIEVANKAEFESIQRAMAMPDVLAFVKIVGTLEPLREDQQHRVLRFVTDQVEYESRLGS